jgi:uncharacterized membrane protein
MPLKSATQATPQSESEACLWFFGGCALAWHGIRRSRLLGVTATLVGGTLAYKGFNAWMQLCEAGKASVCSRNMAPERPEPKVEGSRVDEAAWESFPASDAPSWNQGAT